MVEYFEKAKQEQEQKRKLWREKQKARVGAPLAAKPQIIGTPGATTANTKLPEGRRRGAIAARLRATKAKEAVLAEMPGGEILAKAQQLKKTTQRLKNIYRIVNGAAGVTVVGLIVTFLVMNAQLIFGNLLKARLIPKLELPEIIIIAVVDFILLTALAIIIVNIVIIAMIMTKKWELFKLLWLGEWKSIKGLF